MTDNGAFKYEWIDYENYKETEVAINKYRVWTDDKYPSKKKVTILVAYPHAD